MGGDAISAQAGGSKGSFESRYTGRRRAADTADGDGGELTIWLGCWEEVRNGGCGEKKREETRRDVAKRRTGSNISYEV